MKIVVIGAGVVGLGAAWRCAARGADVTLVDPEPASGASGVAAGMLAPVSELDYGEEALLRLGVASRNRYPEFVAELEELTGLDTAHRADGLLEVAFDADDLRVLEDVKRFQESLGVPTEVLGRRECRRLEPMLAPTVRGGLYAPQDGSIDPRRLTPALLAAAEKLGARLVRRWAAEVVVRGDAAVGVRLDGGEELPADRVLLAAGPWSGDLGGIPPGVVPPVRPVKGQVLRLRLGGIPPGVVPPVRPVKGQVLRLRSRMPLLGRTVRGVVRGSSIYLVPRADGELVVGATQEELGFDTRVTAGGLWELLRDARELVPGVTELDFAEAAAGLRPGSPDNAPVLGPSALPGLVLGVGHYRNGILLAPVSADALCAALLDGELPEVARPFSPDRFSPGSAPRFSPGSSPGLSSESSSEGFRTGA
ncbi:FAD-dependent oxidoreductase [Actinomadura logoneensis]|uniref:FAD-dependent oxidoreductase n=1 Tax=Actinomadura logoneensis TaxID=2293572 RepID=A0A372JN03_9ACTN|nr:glycine oxidase ThiO [Actinomadura logoneensis]RFU41329.1 FAD-dependent oxidoreductase [Actinomadura logoneensis]